MSDQNKTFDVSYEKDNLDDEFAIVNGQKYRKQNDSFLELEISDFEINRQVVFGDVTLPLLKGNSWIVGSAGVGMAGTKLGTTSLEVYIYKFQEHHKFKEIESDFILTDKIVANAYLDQSNIEDDCCNVKYSCSVQLFLNENEIMNLEKSIKACNDPTINIGLMFKDLYVPAESLSRHVTSFLADRDALYQIPDEKGWIKSSLGFIRQLSIKENFFKQLDVEVEKDSV